MRFCDFFFFFTQRHSWYFLLVALSVPFLHMNGSSVRGRSCFVFVCVLSRDST